jgi:hypothetical protein
MKRKSLLVLPWCATAAFLAWSVVRIQGDPLPIDAPRGDSILAPHPLLRPSAESLGAAAVQAASGNLFRADREPAGDEHVVEPQAEQMQLRPQLVLRGIVGGRSWDVLVEGIPGVPGVGVLRPGEPLGGIGVRSVRGGAVVLVGYDTTWTLRLPGEH